MLSGLAATVVAVLAPPLAAPASAAGQPNQVITMQAATASSTTARLDLWQRSSLGGF